MKANPIDLVKELTFSSFASRQLGFSGRPNGLSLSPNGQHLLINSEDNIYYFDLDQPDRGWQDSFDISDINKVAATDSGGAWILSNEQVRLLKIDSNGVREYPVDSVEMIWGNDNWFITHDNSEKVLKFVSLDDHLIRMVKFNKVILHAWKHGNQLRILAISEHRKRIYLYEWAYDNEKPVLKHCIQYAGIIGIPGMRMDYTFTPHVHAWPNPDGSLSIKLLPWAVIVTADGCLHINKDSMAWTPVIHSDSPLSRLKLAELSAYALDDGLARPSGYCSEPYLITTLQTEDHVHIISTLWHKKVPIDLIDGLDSDALEENLKNEDVAEFLFAACDEVIPPLKSMAGLVLLQLDGIRTPAQLPASLMRRHVQIEQLFRQMFPSELKTFVEDECSFQADAFTEMHSILEKLGRMPSLISIFFDALNDNHLTDDDRHVLVAKCLRRIIHVLPRSVRSRAPAHVVNHALSLRKSILYAEPDAAAFLIDKAPPHFFSPENMIAIFERFPTHSKVINGLFTRMEALKKRLKNISASKKAKLSGAIAHTINTRVGHQYVLNVYGDHIELPFEINRSYIDVLDLLRAPDFQIQPLVEAMADHANDKNRRFCGFLNTALEYYDKQRLIPTFVRTMNQLNAAKNQDDLMELDSINADICQQLKKAGKMKLIETIWHMADDLEAAYRKPFAIVLLAAIERCYGEDAIDSDATGVQMTAEAMILQKKRTISTRPMQALMTYIGQTPNTSRLHAYGFYSELILDEDKAMQQAQSRLLNCLRALTSAKTR